MAAARVAHRSGHVARAVRGSIPDWLDERLSAMDSPDTLIEALNRQASLTCASIRSRPSAMPCWSSCSRAQAVMNRSRCRIRHGASAWRAVRPSTAGPSSRTAASRCRTKAASCWPWLVARRGEMIIDFCAGAGGKTLLLGALMRSTGRLYAFDVSAARLARAKPRFARSGLSNVVPVAIDSENDTRIKRLAGRPSACWSMRRAAASATLRRNPDLKWRQHPEALAELGQLQERIPNSAARCVAPGGRLVYATCSLLAEENEVQAERFLASHPEFERLDAAAILAGRCENLKLEGPYATAARPARYRRLSPPCSSARRRARRRSRMPSRWRSRPRARWTTHRRKPGRMPARRRIRQPAKPPESPADFDQRRPAFGRGAFSSGRGRDAHGSAVATDAQCLVLVFHFPG